MVSQSFNENVKHILGYVSRSLQVVLWVSLFYFWLANDVTWISNVKQFFISYSTALVLGLIGHMLLGYIFDQRKPQSYIISTIMMIPYTVVFGLIIYFGGYLVPYLG